MPETQTSTPLRTHAFRGMVIAVAIAVIILLGVLMFGSASALIGAIFTPDMRAWADKPITEMKIGEAIIIALILRLIF
jgi:hypothetical protein